MKNFGVGFILFPFAWKFGAWRQEGAWACQLGPFSLMLSAEAFVTERLGSHMKNDNDLILERLRGVPANKPSWRDKFDAGNPNVIQTNDNQPTRPSRAPGQALPPNGDSA